MERVMRLVRVRTDLPEAAATDGPQDRGHEGLSGYMLERTSARAPACVAMAWGYVMVRTGPSAGAREVESAPRRTRTNGGGGEVLQLKPVGRLVPLAAPQVERVAAPAARALRPVQGGQTYRIASPPARRLVTPELAEALETVFERFARERGFTAEKPLQLALARGFKAGSQGHGEGRAADIAAVGGKSMLDWQREWEEVAPAAEADAEPQASADARTAEHRRNLGYGLYKALQAHGGWRVNEAGWRPYRGVVQLFGPWTASEGPWRPMQIKDPNPCERQRLADQQWVFRAHRDHIHVAR